MRLSAPDSDETPGRDADTDPDRTVDLSVITEPPGATERDEAGAEQDDSATERDEAASERGAATTEPDGAGLPEDTVEPARVSLIRRVVEAAARIVPWALVGVALVSGLLTTGTPASDIARYAAYWLLCLVLPGTLVFRFLRGSRGNLTEDLGYGAATGLILELVAWALAAATGGQDLLWAWPIPVALTFLAVPSLRRHWRTSNPRPLPVAWSWAMAAVASLTVAWMFGQWIRLPLPLGTLPYYQDLLYHLSLIHEMSRDMPFEVPQMAGEPLRYHYLSNAHMATASMITGVDPPLVLFRLWIGPVIITAVLVISAFARELARRSWAGPVAALLALVAQMEAPIGQSVATSSLPLSQVSPSLTYLIPIFVLLAALCADLARRRPLGWAWCLFVATAVACAGAKSSGLPVLVAGMGLTIVAGLIARRKIYWPAVAGLAALLATMAVGAVAFAGGGASVLKFQALSFLAVLTPYREIARLSPGVIPDDAVVPGLADLDRAGWMFVLLLVAWWLLLQLPRVVGMMVLLRRRTRGDGAVWLLAGALVAGLGGMWMLYHPALSQGYFYLQVVPLGALLTVMLLADALPEDSRTTPIVVGAAAGAGGLAAYFLPVAVPAPLERTYAAWSWALAQPFLVLAVLAIVLGVVWYIARLFFRPLRSHGFAAYLVVLVACSGLGGAILIQESVDLARDDTEYILEIYGSRISADGSRIVTRSEIQAALWLDAHAGEQDVVATNVHCLTPPTKRGCDSRAFWVTGFGGRRAVIEGWGYTDEAVAAHGTNRLGYQVQPPADLERFELNERVFDSPTEEDLRTLRDRYGVRWLLADTDAGKVSPRLVRFARPRMADGPVTIYELPPP